MLAGNTIWKGDSLIETHGSCAAEIAQGHVVVKVLV